MPIARLIDDPLALRLLLELRLPRTIAAILLGAAMTIVLTDGGAWAIPAGAAAGALVGLAAAYQIARRLRFGGWILRLVLSGIAVSALLSAGVGLVRFVADPLEQLPAITFWMLGGGCGTWGGMS